MDFTHGFMLFILGMIVTVIFFVVIMKAMENEKINSDDIKDDN